MTRQHPKRRPVIHKKKKDDRSLIILVIGETIRTIIAFAKTFFF